MRATAPQWSRPARIRLRSTLCIRNDLGGLARVEDIANRRVLENDVTTRLMASTMARRAEASWARGNLWGEPARHSAAPPAVARRIAGRYRHVIPYILPSYGHSLDKTARSVGGWST